MSAAAARRTFLEAAFRRALEAVDPVARVREALDDVPGARWVVLAAGKAAAAMAAAVEAGAGGRLRRGLVVTKEGYGLPLARCALREAGHPIPDARSAAAGHEALALAAGVAPDETLLVLLSGGASALLSTPAPGLAPEHLAAATARLLAAGADIGATNAVRKHLGAVGGGRLARAAARAAHVEVLVLSDVLGDRLDVIASGPCAADPTTFADALAVVERLGLRGALPAPVEARLEAGAAGELPGEETPKPGDPALARVRHRILAGNGDALRAAQDAAREAGWRPVLASDALRGEARRAGRRLAALSRALRPGRLCLAAGGETTVTVRGRGRGGRSQELALAAALELAGSPGTTLLAAGTDGTDGPTDAAGAFADGATVERGAARGRDARADLEANDSYGFFAAEGGHLRTGPTRTNAMDLVLVAVE